VSKPRSRLAIEILDGRTLLLLLGNVWFRVEVDALPGNQHIEKVIDGETRRWVVAEPRYDVVLRRSISRAMSDELRQCNRLYGSHDLYAVSNRQVSTREIKAHWLRG